MDLHKVLKPCTDEERALWESAQKILAIKRYRERLGEGLVEAYCVFHRMTLKEHHDNFLGLHSNTNPLI